MTRRWIMARRNWAMALLVLTLAVRAIIPTGFMPSAHADGFKISLCTGMGTVEAWLGKDGKIHKDAPAKDSPHQQPCAFAGLMSGASLPNTADVAAPNRLANATPAPRHFETIAVGRGLAAPPPPQTGPPALI